MSDKFRVMFNVPADRMTSKLYSPVEIPVEDYIELRMAERDGNKDLMAHYVTKHYLKRGSNLSGDDVSMTHAVGNPMYIWGIDEAIEQGRNPLEEMNKSGDDEEDDYYNSDNGTSSRSYSREKTPEEKAKDNKNTIIAISVIVGIIALFFIIGFSIPEDTRTDEEKLEEVKNNAADVWNNIKNIGDTK